MINPISLKDFVKKYLRENTEPVYDEDMIDEERITNMESKEFVKQRENFIGSHIFGEDLGDIGEMYVAYSYTVPAYLYYDGTWYHNTDDFKDNEGDSSEFHQQHMQDMMPAHETHGLSGRHMETMIRKFMKANNIPEIEHTQASPGTKN